MSNTELAGAQALLQIVSEALDSVSEAAGACDEAGSAELQQLCLNHLDSLVQACEQAGFGVLKAISEGMIMDLACAGDGLRPERAAEIVNWLADVQLHLAAPGDAEIVGLLMKPLTQDSQQLVVMALEAQGDASTQHDAHTGAEHRDADSAPDIAGFPAADEADAFMADSDEAHVFAFEDSAMEIEDDDMLGMLAAELREIAPQLSEMALTLSNTSKGKTLAETVEGYGELVNRVGTVSRELGLDGLVLVCDFILKNLVLLAELPVKNRVGPLELLQGWPRVVIDHLTSPEDDARCIAVIDYLEKEQWPEPLPYAQMRDLVEGLTKGLELSGDLQVEQRQIDATPEDVSLEMSADASPELIEAFFAESPTHAETLSRLISAISRGEEVQKNLEAAQRIAHTLKGSGNLVGLNGIANLAHHIEDIFEYVARHKIQPPTVLANNMQEVADCIESMLESLQGMAPPPQDAQRILQELLDWANRIDSGNLRGADFLAEELEAFDQQVGSVVADAGAARPVERRRNAETEERIASTRNESVRVPLRVLDNIFRVVSETAITTGQIQERLNRLEESEKMIRKNDNHLQQMRYELENLVSVRGMAARHRGSAGNASMDFDPLEMDEYDEFYGATHSYIEGVADSREILRAFTGEVYELNALFLLQQRLNKELQQVVMTTRMVPVSMVSARLQRALRQACRATGKQAELTILGQDLLLDGDVLNKLADPLMHMLRNAVDHGIEEAEIRLSRDKPASGRITLDFRQEGNNVVVECSDDGAGLDYKRIRATAIERKLLNDNEPADNQALARLILQPGFSTSTNVTQVSGRGVGMDVVHDAIQSLNGGMDIEDSASGGTRISLRVPITLLTSHCLLAGAGKDRIFAIPTISLAQILAPGTGKIGRVGDSLTYQLGKEVYDACSLNSLVGIEEQYLGDDIEHCSVLLVQTASGISAVTVDRVVTSYDLVVKNMGAYVKSITGVAGVSMLGDGTVVTVLDLGSLLQSRDSLNNAYQPGPGTSRADADAPSLPRVLIVDDSLSVRSSLSQLVSDGGYRVITAKDGLEAIDLLDSEDPDVVLTDLEMPRMNGLDLASYIRKSSRWSQLPIVMITSRTMAKHREQASQVGINQYLTKPFSEDDVLAAIDAELAVSS